MVFTIEPMINAGKAAISELPDGWTIVTKDRSLSAQWEHTVRVTETGVEVLTLSAGAPPCPRTSGSPPEPGIRTQRSAIGCSEPRELATHRASGWPTASKATDCPQRLATEAARMAPSCLPAAARWSTRYCATSGALAMPELRPGRGWRLRTRRAASRLRR
jgi:hypothetical protein